MDKRVANAEAVIGRIKDGATILMGAFGICGVAGKSDRRADPPRHEKSDGGLEQSRHGRFRHRRC